MTSSNTAFPLREYSGLNGEFRRSCSGRNTAPAWITTRKDPNLLKSEDPKSIFRFVSKYIMGQTTQKERYLTNLAGKFGEPQSLGSNISCFGVRRQSAAVNTALDYLALHFNHRS
jgi:hypothetical protein